MGLAACEHVFVLLCISMSSVTLQPSEKVASHMNVPCIVSKAGV